MKGLLRNNFYATLSNAKTFSVILLFLGIFVVAMDNTIATLIIDYMLLVMIGFSFNSIASVRKESATKWHKYKLTTPVRRTDIVKSLFVSELLWLAVGITFAAVSTALSISLHGNPFDRNMDIFMLFVIGVGISLFMGAIFFPLFFLGGEERNEVSLILSLLGAVGCIMGLKTLINAFFPAGMTDLQLFLSGVMILACGILAFAVSCPLTACIFHKREY